MKIRLLLFGDVIQHILVIVCRRFGAAYLSHLQGSGIPRRIGIGYCLFVCLYVSDITKGINARKFLRIF
jgi:hypothetical protein